MTSVSASLRLITPCTTRLTGLATFVGSTALATSPAVSLAQTFRPTPTMKHAPATRTTCSSTLIVYA